MSHYLLPDGNVQIAFSGGRTSAYMLHQILEANGDLPDRAVVSYQNTGREMPETLDFVQEISERWSVPIVWLEYRGDKPWFERVNHNSASRNGEPFDVLISKRKMLPNTAMRFCTAEMKIKTARRYCRGLGWAHWSTARGIRLDEAHRANGSKDKVITNWHPLVDAGVVKSDIKKFWNNQSFNLNLPSVDNGNPFGNCDGCFLKSEASKAALIRHYPYRAAWWIDHEKKMNATFRDQMPLSQLRSFVERQGDWIFDAKNDAFCQADDGECGMAEDET
ncbi:MAG: Nin-like protein [Phycisphaerae bacterium]|nr:Nin-like protein [Phycisphaerae bacterium]|tara:strand:- start:173 stop:1003 length:831 start_codon:yes stop_codon:yes gene_type:complete